MKFKIIFNLTKEVGSILTDNLMFTDFNIFKKKEGGQLVV